MGLTFANYVLQPFFPGDCAVPVEAAQLLAGATICFLTFINCYDVKFTTKLQNIFMFTKIAALVIVIIVGVVWMAYGKLMIKYNFFLLTNRNYKNEQNKQFQVIWRILKNHLKIPKLIQANYQLHFILAFFHMPDGII